MMTYPSRVASHRHHPKVSTLSESTVSSTMSCMPDIGQSSVPPFFLILRQVPHARIVPPLPTNSFIIRFTLNLLSLISSHSTPLPSRKTFTECLFSIALTPYLKAFHASSGSLVEITSPIFKIFFVDPYLFVIFHLVRLPQDLPKLQHALPPLLPEPLVTLQCSFSPHRDLVWPHP